MGNLNPVQLLMALKANNPQQVATSIIQQNFPNDPTFRSLLQMAANNDIQGIEKFAQQYFTNQGLDFGTEMNNLLTAVSKMQGDFLYKSKNFILEVLK